MILVRWSCNSRSVGSGHEVIIPMKSSGWLCHAVSWLRSLISLEGNCESTGALRSVSGRCEVRPVGDETYNTRFVGDLESLNKDNLRGLSNRG